MVSAIQIKIEILFIVNEYTELNIDANAVYALINLTLVVLVQLTLKT